MSAIRGCISCAHYEPDYVDYDGDTYGSCGLDEEIIAGLPANWHYCPRERSMPDAWEDLGCVRWKEVI